MSIRVGHILRHEDESGVSGTGVVAEWIEYSDGEVVVHWLSHTPSTNHYRNIKQVESIHGHGGKTEMVTIWEQPKPEPEPESAKEETQEDGEVQSEDHGEDLGDPEPPKKALEKEEKPKRTPRKKAPPKNKSE